MRFRRAAVGFLGLVVLVLAWAVGEGHLGGVLPVDAVVAALGNDYFLVAGLAGLTLALAIPVLASGRSGNLDRTEMPDPEEPISMPTPGDGFDETTGRWTTRLPVIAGRRRKAVRDRLRRTAVAVVASSDACGHAEAERRVDRGEWTSDPTAAAFVSNTSRAGLAIAVRIQALLDGETGLSRRARRTVDAIAEYDGRREG